MHYKYVRTWDLVTGSLGVGDNVHSIEDHAGFSPGVLATLSSVTFLTQATLLFVSLFSVLQHVSSFPLYMWSLNLCSLCSPLCGISSSSSINPPLGACNLQARCVSMSSKNNYNHSRSWKLTLIECLLSHSQRSEHTTHINSFSASRSLYFRIFSIIIVNFIYVYK